MSLKELLEGRSITCAHIIDDAFDDAPASGLNEESVGLILSQIGEKDFAKLCETLEVKDQDEAKIRDQLTEPETFAALYRKKAELGDFLTHELFHEFEVDRKGKLEQLQPLLDVLANAGVICLTFGADYDPKDTAVPQLFFVDLKLRENTLRPAHEDAKEALDRLKFVHKGAKPFVFLMSSQTIALGNSRDEFRRASALFQSEFESIEKGCFSDGSEVERMLARYTAAIEVHAALHASMEQVKVAVSNAAENVLDELRSLDFADYFVLFKNTVSVERIDLGSYIVELLLEYLANEVEGKEKVWGLAAELNNLEMANLRRVRFGWTPAAMRLYSASMLHHPEMLRSEEKMSTGPSQGYFCTGDIFFDAKSYNEGSPEKALAVITPACDLVRPHEMKGKSVVLCEGAVRHVTEANPQLTADDGLPVTLMKHPKDSNQFITILWNKKKIHVWDDDARAAFQDANKCLFVRAGRLRPLFALQLQQKVTSDLSRVGTQKPPSALNLRGVRCYVNDGSTWSEVYADATSDAAAWLISEEGKGKKRTKIVTLLLSDHTVQRTLEKVKAWHASNPDACTRLAVERVLQDDVRDLLKHASAPVLGGDEDPTIYPLKDAAGQTVKHLALVREVKSSSPYAAIQDGSRRTEKHEASVVFRLETGA